MKATIISMLVVLVMLTAVPAYFMNDGDMMSDFFGGGSVGKESIASLKAKAPKNVTNAVTDKKVQVYKWVDENGVMQFSQTPPRLGGEHESMTLQPDTNLMKAYKAPEKEPEPKQTAKVFKTNPYTPSGMKDMLDKTSAIKDQLNSQQADQQKMLDDIMSKTK